MKLRQSLRRILAAALCLMLCAGLAQPAWAAKYGQIPNFSSTRNCSLKLTYGHEVEKMNVRLYRVASVNADVQFKAEGKFKEYLKGVDLNKLTQSGWRKLAEKLVDKVMGGGDTPTKLLQVGKDGTVTFQNLKPGLYLVFTDALVEPKLDDQKNPVYDKDGKPLYVLHRTIPYLVSLPTWYGSSGGSGSSGGWVWEINANVEAKVSDEEKTEINIRVFKTWSDSEKKHDPIKIRLKKDGVLYGDPIELPWTDQAGAERWEYYWEGLELGPKWTVSEDSVPGYTTTITETMASDGTYQFTINNKKNSPHVDPPGGEESEPPESKPPAVTPTPGADVTPTPGIDITPTPGPDVTPTPGPNVTPTPNPEPTPTPGITPPPAQSNPPRPSTPPPLEEIEIDDPGTPLGPPPPDQDPPDGPEEIELDDPDTPLGDLPQTGQLWWPVPVLAIAGMFLFLIGWALRRRDGYDEE